MQETLKDTRSQGSWRTLTFSLRLPQVQAGRGWGSGPVAPVPAHLLPTSQQEKMGGDGGRKEGDSPPFPAQITPSIFSANVSGSPQVTSGPKVTLSASPWPSPERRDQGRCRVTVGREPRRQARGLLFASEVRGLLFAADTRDPHQLPPSQGGRLRGVPPLLLGAWACAASLPSRAPAYLRGARWADAGGPGRGSRPRAESGAHGGTRQVGTASGRRESPIRVHCPSSSARPGLDGAGAVSLTGCRRRRGRPPLCLPFTWPDAAAP